MEALRARLRRRVRNKPFRVQLISCPPGSGQGWVSPRPDLTLKHISLSTGNPRLARKLAGSIEGETEGVVEDEKLPLSATPSDPERSGKRQLFDLRESPRTRTMSELATRSSEFSIYLPRND